MIWFGRDEDRTHRAEKLFRDDLEAGRIQFRLRIDGKNWKMPKTSTTTEPEGSRKFLIGEDGSVVKKSLFASAYSTELYNAEQNVAVMLDATKSISWWHRNVAQREYGPKGWKRGRLFPDFIFAVKRSSG